MVWKNGDDSVRFPLGEMEDFRSNDGVLFWIDRAQQLVVP